jgi:invasion protein IalB
MRLKSTERAVLPLLLVAAIALPSPVSAQPNPAATNPASQATLLGQFGDWGAYTANPGGRKVCFVLSKPTASQDNPPNRRSAANVVYLFVSTRPDEKVKDEVSMLITGYAFKPNSEAAVTIGNTDFAMYTQNDGAWVKNAAEEAQLVDAMRKGADAVIKATTSKGTKTTDTFSLKGISQALERVGQECQ